MLFDILSSKKSSTTPYKSRKIKSLKLSAKGIFLNALICAGLKKVYHVCVKCPEVFSQENAFLLKSLKNQFFCKNFFACCLTQVCIFLKSAQICASFDTFCRQFQRNVFNSYKGRCYNISGGKKVK
jgi:hypothetical protein